MMGGREKTQKELSEAGALEAGRGDLESLTLLGMCEYFWRQYFLFLQNEGWELGRIILKFLKGSWHLRGGRFYLVYYFTYLK